MKAFADSLSRADDWDEMMLRDMRMDSTASAWLLLSDRAMLSRGRFRADPFGSARCPYIPLPHCWEDYLAAMSRNSRQLLRRKRRVLESKAETAYSSTEDPEKIQDAMRNFASLHQLRWEERDRPGCFASVVFDGFIRKVTPRLADAGKLRLGSLRIDGTPAAMYYLLKDGDRLFYYNSGVDVQRFGPLSPGSVCLGYVIEEAIRRGEKEFHFLKGGADSYKWHWTDQSVLVNSMIVRRKGWKDSVCVCNARLIEWMRASFRTCSPRVSRT
jgi:CelD/BcsL family acetyltransferase involved in cellulose biosynthesis